MTIEEYYNKRKKAQFEEAKAFINRIAYSDMHIFPYSRRKGTKADLMKGHLNPKVQKERARILLDIAQKMKNDYEQKYIGKTVEVLVENQKNGYWRGYTTNYLDVHFLSDDNLENQLINVEVVKIDNNTIYGIRKDD